MNGIGALACTGDGMLPLVIGIIVVAVVAIVAGIAAFAIIRHKR